jgi:predicted lipid-binding transport protein (Tim44 family)
LIKGGATSESLSFASDKESSLTATTFDTRAFERATDPILKFFDAEQSEALVAYRGAEVLRARIEELAHKNTEGELTDEEQAEYEGYVSANKFIAILQAKARKLLSDQ